MKVRNRGSPIPTPEDIMELYDRELLKGRKPKLVPVKVWKPPPTEVQKPSHNPSQAEKPSECYDLIMTEEVSIKMFGKLPPKSV